MRKILLLLVGVLMAFTAGAADYSQYWVNIQGDFNGWTDNGVQPGSNNVATHAELPIGTSGFKVKMWTGSKEDWRSTGGAIPQNQWVSITGNANANMTIAGATAGQKFKVEYNVNSNQIRVTPISSTGPVTPVTKSYQIRGTIVDGNWNDYDLTEQDGKWSADLTVKPGDFGIKYLEDGAQKAWIWSSNKTNYTISAPGTFPGAVENNGNGVNWKSTLEGKYNFSFDPTTNVLTVTSLKKVYGLRGYVNNNWTSNSHTFTGSPLSLVIENYQEPDYGFKIHDGAASYGTVDKDAAAILRGGSIVLKKQTGTGYNINLAPGAIGKDVTLTLEVNDAGEPTKLIADWEATATIVGEWGGHAADWTGAGTSYTSTPDGYYQFDVTPTADGDLKFRFKIDNQDRCPASGANTAVTNNSTNATKNGNTGYFYIGGAKADKTYTIKYKIDNGQVTVNWVNTPVSTYNYYLAAGFLNNWDASKRVQFTPSATDPNVLTASARYHESNAGNKGFKITTKATTDDGTWYSTGSTLSNDIEVNIEGKTEDANMKLNKKALNQDVVFTLTLNSEGKPVTLKATWEGTENNVQIVGNLTNAGIDVNSWEEGVTADPVGNNVYSYTFTATNGGKIWFGFVADGTRYYPLWGGDCPATSDDTADASKAFNSKKQNGTCWEYTVQKGKFYAITVDLSAGDGQTTPVRFTVSETMPVYPSGVYNLDGLQRYDKWPVLYVQSTVLNNNRITPEYQMNKISDSRYELEFTLRNTKTEGANWGAGEYPLSIVGFTNANSGVKTYVQNVNVTLNKTRANEGARYKAVCEKGSNGNWNLTLTPVSDEKEMPFLSMIGKEWKQRTTATTPFNGHKTSEGWQEAWVQYDSRGQLRLDRNGNVMYNTCWPPRNTILFKTEFEVNGAKKDFTIKSDQLTFSAVESKTGKEWKEDARFAKYAQNVEDLDEGNPTEHVGKLALKDDRRYTLYRAKNMWVNGEVKLWTGWGGVYSKDQDASDDNALANWSWHSNWGHFGEGINATEITPESSVQLSNHDGNVAFAEPTFFQYVDFFYEESDPSAKGHSVLFTELSEGGAQIAAMSTRSDATSVNEYEVGNFQPSLNYLQGLDEGDLKKVTIRSYATTTDGDRVVEEMIADLYNWSASEGNAKKNKDFYTLFQTLEGNDELPGNGAYTNNNTENKSVGKWVKDETSYNNGDYFYRMTVVLTDNNGVTHTVTVDSNPFTIFNAEEKITCNVYQLVKVGEEMKNGVRTGHYYTYKGSKADHSVPVLPAYELWIQNDSKFDTNNEAYDEDGNLVGYIDDTHYEFTYQSLDELPDYGMSTEEVEGDPTISQMQFTDKILIVGSVPSANVVEGYAFGVADKVETPNKVSGMRKSPITEQYDQSCTREDNENRFMHVTHVGSFEEREFTLSMKYSTSFLDYEGNLVTIDGATTTPVSAQYTVTVPEPKLKEAKVQVFYGNTDGEDTDDDIALFSYRGKDFYARYHSVRDYIEVEFPNVSNFLKERIVKNNFFTLRLSQTVEGERREWDNVFAFTSDDTADGVVVGPVMHPSNFTEKRQMTLISDPNYTYYTRWEDGEITPIHVTENPPINFNHEIKDASWFIDANGHLISRFTVVVKHTDDYVPSDPADNLSDAEKDKHNYVFHEDKDLYEHLHHHGENDYYYVAIVDKDKIVDGDYDTAVIDADGNVTDDDNLKLHDVVSAHDLLVTANGKGKEFTISKDYGEYTDAKRLEAKADHYSKHLNVLVSYLYPFANTETTPSPAMAKRRAAQDYTSNVLKSNPAVGVVNGDFVVTSLDEISAADLGKVITGFGYIEVEGNDVEIYRTDGVKVAIGEGRHEVASGVYLVRLNGRVEKVVVR